MNKEKHHKKAAPSETRTHDLQIAQVLIYYSDYETDALTNCATEAYIDIIIK